MMHLIPSLSAGTLRRLLAVALLALPIGACGGKECESCQSDEDCASEGLVCTKFQDGSMRCGSGVGATTCRGF
jgi:hypothetical protein